MRCAGATRRSKRAFPSSCAPTARPSASAPRPSETFGKVRHARADALARQRLRRGGRRSISSPACAASWARRGRRVALTAEPKIDGLSISLSYEDGRLVQAATRGDGTEGENVTANVMTIGRSRSGWRDAACPELIEVRGEIYMRHADFAALNARAGGGGRQGLRQSAQRGGRLAAPARCLDHGAPAAALLRLCLGGDRARCRPTPSSASTRLRANGACRSTR